MSYSEAGDVYITWSSDTDQKSMSSEDDMSKAFWSSDRDQKPMPSEDDMSKAFWSSDTDQKPMPSEDASLVP